MDNMKLWDSFGKTDPKYTQTANVDGNKQTSLSGNYMVKLATESLGPIGEGWGYTILEERFDNTKPILKRGENGPEILYDNGSIVWEKNHTILVEMWHGNRENTFTQYGHTKFIYMKADLTKVIVDNEYAKKSLTDAMKKCLSLIGVCSDVFMGEFDDIGYQQAAQLENDLKKADDRDTEYANKLEEFNNFIDDRLKAMELCPNIDSMQKVYGLAAQKIDREAPLLGLDPAKEKQPLDKLYFDLEALFKKEESK